MKYMKSTPIVDMGANDVFIREGWTPYKRLSKSLSLTFQLMIACVMVVKATALLFVLNPALKAELFNFNVAVMICLFALQVLIHEIVHACFMPGGLKSNEVYMGISISSAFVYTTQEIKKSRYLLMTVMPLFLLSGLFPVILYIFGALNQYMFIFCFLNAVGSCSDCLNLLLVSMGVPKGARIICNGPQIYFRH